MALLNSGRTGALITLLFGCSSQSIEAVGSASCLAAQLSPPCAGAAGRAFGGSAGALGSGGASGGSTGGSPGGGESAGTAGTGEPVGSLIHRYSFDGTGTAVKDSVGDADGIAVNATLGGGAVSVADDTTGGNQEMDQFVDLPNQLVSTLRNATLEAWLTWVGGAPWQRIFDFGDDTNGVEGERSRGNGKTYLFLTPQTPTDKGAVLRAAFQAEEIHEVYLDAKRAVPRGVKTHVALVVDSDAGQMLLYMNGELENAMAFAPDSLPLIHDVNNWLGRSNYFYDPCFTGTFHEFRMYSAALNAAQVRQSYDAGSETPVPGL